MPNFSILDGLNVNGSPIKFNAKDILADGDDTMSMFYGYDLEEGDIPITISATDPEEEDDEYLVHYYFVTVPKINYDGKPSVLKAAISDESLSSESTSYSLKTVRDFAVEKVASLAINGGYFQLSAGTNLPYGPVIVDGELIYEGEPYATGTNPEILGILPDGSFRYYDSANYDSNLLLADDVQYSVVGRYAVIKEGVAVRDDETVHNRMQFICYDADNYYVFTAETGLTTLAAAEFLLDKGVQEAFLLDGGGSVSTNLMTVKLNTNKDDHGRTDRKVGQCLYFSREYTHFNKNELTLAMLSSDLRGKIDASPSLTVRMNKASDYHHCDDLPIGSMAYTYTYTGGTPTSEYVRHDTDYDIDIYRYGGYYNVFTFGGTSNVRAQFAVHVKKQQIYFRTRSGGVWSDWISLTKRERQENVRGITATSTDNLIDLGVITSYGYYVVFISRQGTANDTSSAYMIRYTSSNGLCARTVIAEGSAVSAPRLSSDGILTTNSSTSEQSYYIRTYAITSVM